MSLTVCEFDNSSLEIEKKRLVDSFYEDLLKIKIKIDVDYENKYIRKLLDIKINDLACVKIEFLEFCNNFSYFLFNDKYLELLNYKHHKTSTYAHSISVAYKSYIISRRLKMKYSVVTKGALLHDFYLYDWHDYNREIGEKLHGFEHPKISLRNAKKYFGVNKIEADIIRKHMWPLTLLHPPRYKEAILVMLVDKVIASKEILDVFYYSFRYILSEKILAYRFVLFLRNGIGKIFLKIRNDEKIKNKK